MGKPHGSTHVDLATAQNDYQNASTVQPRAQNTTGPGAFSENSTRYHTYLTEEDEADIAECHRLISSINAYEPMKLSPNVEKAIQAVFPSTDPIADAGFDPVEYINGHFPDEASLSGIDKFLVDLQGQIGIVRNPTILFD